ncbi:retrovirus-related pol polyprotein from transposon TNT 1-94 [Tanacetum coccineum]
MYCDNTGALAIVKDHGITKGARHFRIKVHYLRETIEMGDASIEKVDTDDNLVDPFTKALSFPKHSELTKKIGIIPSSSLMIKSKRKYPRQIRGLDLIYPVSSKKENESKFSTKKEQSKEVKQDKSNISGQKEESASSPQGTTSNEVSTTIYIVQQNIAARRGLAALNFVNNMHVVGEVNMVQGQVNKDCQDNAPSAKYGSESGACILWQTSPDLWYLELVVSSWRVSVGSVMEPVFFEPVSIFQRTSERFTT